MTKIPCKVRKLDTSGQLAFVKKISIGTSLEVQWLRISACQCRGHGFDPWSKKTPCAMEQASPCATAAEVCSTQNFLKLFRRSGVNTHIRTICPWTCTKQHFQREIQWLKPALGPPLKRGEEGSREQIPESHFLAHTLHPVPTLVTSPCLSFLVCKMRVTVINLPHKDVNK